MDSISPAERWDWSPQSHFPPRKPPLSLCLFQTFTSPTVLCTKAAKIGSHPAVLIAGWQ